MEEPPFDKTKPGWSRPRHCRRCRYPMARSLEVCPCCQKPARLFSASSIRQTGSQVARWARASWGFTQVLVMFLGAMTAAYYLSPLLLLFPLVALSASPPASRGGKTVSHGAPRRR